MTLDHRGEALAAEREHHRQILKEKRLKMLVQELIMKKRQNVTDENLEPSNEVVPVGATTEPVVLATDIPIIVGENDVSVEEMKGLEILAENLAEDDMEHEHHSFFHTFMEILLMFAMLFCLYFPDLWDMLILRKIKMFIVMLDYSFALLYLHMKLFLCPFLNLDIMLPFSLLWIF